MTERFPILNLPPHNLKLKRNESNFSVFDEIRKKYIILTPEEWVRQHFIHFLINHKKYPKALINVENNIKFNKLNKRSDIFITDNNGNNIALVECKAPNIKINNTTLEQAIRYNIFHKCNIIILTNGISHYCCIFDACENKWNWVNNIPEYNKIQ